MRTFLRIVIAISLLTAGVAAQVKPTPAIPAPAKSAQPRPSFSGHWVITSPVDGAGGEQIVTQDAKTLTVEQIPNGDRKNSRKISYQLDGVERRMAAPRSDFQVMAKASWEGNTIVVITNSSYPNGMKEQAKDTWSIDAQGRLVIDIAEKGPTGPAPLRKLVHVRKK